MMKTYQQGFIKNHKGCDGIIRYVESLNNISDSWVAQCLKCGEIVSEENIKFKRIHKGFHDVNKFYME